jgi:hypothetical protein
MDARTYIHGFNGINYLKEEKESKNVSPQLIRLIQDLS